MDGSSGLLKGPVDTGLTSDVLRVRAAEYYSSCLPDGARIYKSGSMTHLNGCCSSPLAKFGEVRGGVRTPRHFAERPHRTHSERSNHRVGVVVERTATNGVCNGNTVKTGLYRSNSSLDLDHGEDAILDRPMPSRRDYGSASSLDVLGSSGDSFFAMLREYRATEEDQRSPGPAKIQDYLRGKVDATPALQNASNSLANGALEEVQSPKLKTKFHRLLELKDRGKGWSRGNDSIFKKLRGGGRSDSADTKCAEAGGLDPAEEKLRKKAFAHYDCQSITADLSEASTRLASLLSKRRNTTTGASAASMLSRTPECCGPEDADPDCATLDAGDGRETVQLLSCPFFRNEIGGEEERAVCLNRVTCQRPQKQGKAASGKSGGKSAMPHRPVAACGLSVLEGGTTAVRWKLKACPYQRPTTLVEGVDHGALYYRTYFHGKEHQNWFGIDEHLGPVAASIRRERIDEAEGSSNSTSSSTNSLNQQSQYQYRLVIRTSELAVLRGAILEDAIPNLPSPRSIGSSGRNSLPVREVLDYVAPELQASCLRLGIQGQQTEEQLMKLDEQGLMKTYKVGVMYCKAGQATEEEMYNNELSGPAFEEFLEMLGHKVRLKGFENYRAGLDNKTDTTGLYSLYATFENCEVMFHVSTLLPYTPNNKQQLLRKRHIGNDIVTIVFQEPDALPFTPKNIRSHFQHVFIVVRAIDPCTENTRYSVAVSRSKEVPVFGPPIPEGATFPKSKKFTEFMLAKVINAENAAHRSEKFATMAQRTRQEYLKDLANNYSTNLTLESGPKFSILNFGIKKKERGRARFIPDSFVQGAIAWQVQVEDYGQSSVCDCILGISTESLVLLEESTRELVFGCPTSSIVGWSSHSGSLKLFYHQGECVVLKTKDPEVDEIQEIVTRLSCVTAACETQELILRRNSLGQLGFHVQFEGIVTEVESYGFAWQAGLRKGCRLVEICKVAVATLSYEQMVDLLKTSMTVSVTVVPAHKDGSPRRGCNLHNCSYLAAGMGDYENVGGLDVTESSSVRGHAAAGQQVPSYSQFSARNEAQLKGHNQQPRHFDNRVENHHRPASSRSYPSPPPVPARASRTPPGGGVGGYRTPESPSSLPPLSGHSGGLLSDHAPLTHVGSLVASRSELSLAQLTSSTHHHHHHHHHHLSSVPFGYGGRVLQAVENFSAQTRSQGSPSLLRDFVKGSEKSAGPPASSDYQSDSSSDWQLGTSSADELSCGSHRSTPPRSCSYRSDLGSSRNNSPRIPARRGVACEPGAKPNRLRPTACSSASSRPPSSVKAGGSSAGSGGSTGSTLQEDLLKLISPEYLDSDSEEPASVPSESGSCHTCLSTPYSSLERTSRNLRDPADDGDVILTKAQPAQVVASEPSSPAPPERRMTRDERLSPRVTSDKVLGKLKPPVVRAPPPMLPVPEGRNLDWPTLVDTATKAMQVARTLASKGSWSDAMPLPPPPPKETMSNGQPVKQLHDLEEKVVKLQETLAMEQHRKATLEQQVRHLQEENHRLHEESQSATAQLKKLTDWFFNAMDT